MANPIEQIGFGAHFTENPAGGFFSDFQSAPLMSSYLSDPFYPAFDGESRHNNIFGQPESVSPMMFDPILGTSNNNNLDPF